MKKIKHLWVLLQLNFQFVPKKKKKIKHEEEEEEEE
jgi:hypothetical protein